MAARVTYEVTNEPLVSADNDNPRIIFMGNTLDQFPMIENIWNFFSSKERKTVFFSVGTGLSPLVELELMESLGCPVHIFDMSKENCQKWTDVSGVLKTRKVTETTSNFAKEAIKKWVLPRNINVYDKLPFYYEGTLKQNNNLNDINTVSMSDVVSSINPSDPRIDLLKIDLPNYEHLVISSVIHEGFRPSLLLVRWTYSLDSHFPTLNMVGYLNMLGYSLIGKIDNKCLYYYSDTNMFQLCNWDSIGLKNPLIQSIVNDVQQMIKNNDKDNNDKNNDKHNDKHNNDKK